MASSCQKCHRPLQDCRACNAGRASNVFGKLTCSKCTDGQTCPQCGPHWKR